MAGRRNRGITLIVVLGVLVVLALLGTMFAVLAGLEREISRNYLDMVRARLVAQSGVEKAVTTLPELIVQNPFGDPSKPISRSWVYYGGEGNEANPPQPDVNLEVAVNPSFAHEDEDPQDPSNPVTTPKTITLEGQPVGFSGTMSSGAYGRHADLFTLRVNDLSGRIHVNDGVTQYEGNDNSVSRNLRRILNRLGDVVGAPGVGDAIVDQRPALGYVTTLELEKVVGETAYQKIRNYVTTMAWVDWNVCNPVPFSASMEPNYPIRYHRESATGPPTYRLGRGKDCFGGSISGDLKWGGAPGVDPQSVAHAVYAMDELNPQWIEIAGRAPVNVNSAPREVLIALLSDLQGVFLSYRRRNNIEPNLVGGYWLPPLIHTFSPGNPGPPIHDPGQGRNVPTEGDEFGFLYQTVPIRHPTGTTGWTEFVDYIDAGRIADQIIECRQKLGPYAGATFGGPFRTWRQFNAFCDYLVTAGIIQDQRTILYDYKPNGGDVVKPGNITGTGPLVQSDYQRQLAARAIADVLKANFNPNLHLNELNPDSNLYMLVDKTDLIVHSTEFIFVPNGCFEIESIGRVLRPDGGIDAFTAADNKVVAEERILAGVQLFEMYRETNQKQFMAGTCSGRQYSLNSNSNLSLEIGPEVNNGPAPLENEWSGYIALPTAGGLGMSLPNPGSFKKTVDADVPNGGQPYGEEIRVHFQWDFDAQWHSDNVRNELARASVAGEVVSNYPDVPETAGGPYAPWYTNGKHRLARSFRLPEPGSGSSALPDLYAYGPLDLRIDGAYVERHSAPAWWISTQTFFGNAKDMSAVASFWMKPSYPPDKSGKPRLMLNANRYCANSFQRGGLNLGNEAYYAMYFTAGHETYPLSGTPPHENANAYIEKQYMVPSQDGFGFIPFRPESIVFGRGYGPTLEEVPRYYSMVQAPVNHEAHNDNIPSLMRDHRWIHVTLITKPRPEGHVSADYHAALSVPPLPAAWPTWNRFYINGIPPASSLEYYVCQDWINPPPGDPRNPDPPPPEDRRDDSLDYTIHATGHRNCVRFGCPSVWVPGYSPSKDNFSCDATIDEFYLWGNASVADEQAALDQWLSGRYYKPVGGGAPDAREGAYVSAQITLSALDARSVPPASGIAPPAGSGFPTTPTLQVEESGIEIIGLSWTSYGEDPGDVLRSVRDEANGLARGVQMPMYIKTASLGLSGPYQDDGFTPLSLKLPAAEPFQYVVNFDINGVTQGSILMTTPVLDDVTVYYRSAARSTYYYYVLASTIREM